MPLLYVTKAWSQVHCVVAIIRKWAGRISGQMNAFCIILTGRVAQFWQHGVTDEGNEINVWWVGMGVGIDGRKGMQGLWTTEISGSLWWVQPIEFM